jgi:hypothetical protein
MRFSFANFLHVCRDERSGLLHEILHSTCLVVCETRMEILLLGRQRCAFCLGFVVTFRVCAGLRGEIREGTENFGEEMFRVLRDRVEARLIWKLFNVRGN